MILWCFYACTQIAPNGGAPHLNLVITKAPSLLQSIFLYSFWQKFKRLLNVSLSWRLHASTLDIKLTTMPLIHKPQHVRIFQSYPIIGLSAHDIINKLYLYLVIYGDISSHSWNLKKFHTSVAPRWNQKRTLRSPTRLFLFQRCRNLVHVRFITQ